jgi:hypothetical protein
MSETADNSKLDELQATLSEQLGEGWGSAVIRAEVQQGAGAIDLYVIGKDGEVFHRTSVSDLTSKLFNFVYSLPPQANGVSEDWNVFVGRVVEHQGTTASFLNEAEQDMSLFAERRQRFEDVSFPGKSVRYDPF